MIKNEIFIFSTGYRVAWTDVGDSNLNDRVVNVSIDDRLYRNLQHSTVNELEREVGDTEQIALLCEGELPAGLSDKLLKSVRYLHLTEIYQPDFTE